MPTPENTGLKTSKNVNLTLPQAVKALALVVLARTTQAWESAVPLPSASLN